MTGKCVFFLIENHFNVGGDRGKGKEINLNKVDFRGWTS